MDSVEKLNFRKTEQMSYSKIQLAMVITVMAKKSTTNPIKKENHQSMRKSTFQSYPLSLMRMEDSKYTKLQQR